MATTKISEMTPAGSVGTSDIFPIVQSGANKSATVQQLTATVKNNTNASDIAYDNTTSGLNATKVQGAVDELNNKFEQMFKVVTYNLGDVSITFAANSTVNITANQLHISTPEGYSPVAIAGYYTGNNSTVPRAISPFSTGTASVGVWRNFSANSWTATGSQLSVTILYVRADLI